MKPTSSYEPRLSHSQPYLYLPSTGADGSGAGIGPGWTTGEGATVSHPTPASTDYTTEFRRTRFTSIAVANLHLGVYFPNADHKAFYRGFNRSRGGFYFSARFKVNAIPNTSIRFFAGMSAGNTAIVTGGVASVPNNTAGLWCDTGHAASLKLVTKDNAGAYTETALTNATTLTAGTLYEFIMICNPAQNPIVTQLVNYGLESGQGGMGTVLNSQNIQVTMPGNSVFMSPQVALGNAANAAGGDTSLDIVSIYAIPNQRLRPTVP